MFNKSHLVGALIALVVIDDIHARIRASKAGDYYLEAQAEFEKDTAAQNAQIKYLCHIIDKHDIDVDEFDMIVLNYQISS